MYKWVIIGGGIQGCCVAARLLGEKVEKEDLLIIDPHSEPMHSWRSLTEKIGMRYLRFPSVHHVDADPYSLNKYAQSNDYAEPFRGKYARPRLDMFNQHSLDAIDQVGVKQCWKQGKVEGLTWNSGSWEVAVTSSHTIRAERVVLAIGTNHVPYYPEWSLSLKGENENIVHHVFELEEPLPEGKSAIIVGGGMTAAHLAYTLSKRNPDQPVHLVKRHPFRVEDFDSDPGWLGPKYLRDYEKVNGYKERRKRIQEARNRGSITRDLHVKLKRQLKEGNLLINTDEINTAHLVDGSVELGLQNNESIRGDCLLLATGANADCPGKSWLQPLINQLDLPCAPCGFPIVQPSLEWKQGLFAAGALAELEIGPVARNIAGARKAAERIVHSA